MLFKDIKKRQSVHHSEMMGVPICQTLIKVGGGGGEFQKFLVQTIVLQFNYKYLRYLSF